MADKPSSEPPEGPSSVTPAKGSIPERESGAGAGGSPAVPQEGEVRNVVFLQGPIPQGARRGDDATNREVQMEIHLG